MEKILDEIGIFNIYKELRGEFGSEFAKTMTAYEKAKVKKYAEKEKMDAERMVEIIRINNELMSDYSPNNMNHYRDAVIVLNILSGNEVKSKEKDLLQTLEQACIKKKSGLSDNKRFEALKSWFIENNKCHPDTMTWIDKKKGSKKSLVSYLKDLQGKGYTCYLSNKEIQAVALNTFRIKIGIDTIKQTGTNEFLKPSIPIYMG